MNIDTHQDVIAFAVNAHAGQERKFGKKEPYVLHPMRVACLLSAMCPEEKRMVVLALLHDTFEDTDTTYDTLATLFGVDMADMVIDLSDMQTSKFGDKATRNRRHASKLQKCNYIVQTVKAADIYDNCRDQVQMNPSKLGAKRYLEEKFLVLNHLDDVDSKVWHLAMDCVKGQLKDLVDV